MKRLALIRRSALVSLVLAALLLLAPVSQVGATGSEYIGGTATTQYMYYYTKRVVTNPSLPGPEVAFEKDSGPNDLWLGAHNCNLISPSVIGGGPFYQSLHTWSPVANLLSANTQFCIVTYGSGGGGTTFNGTLAWD